MNRKARLRRSQSCTTPSAAADTNAEVDGGYGRFGTRPASVPKSVAASEPSDKESLYMAAD